MSPTPTSATVSNDVVGSALVEADLETPTAAPEPTRSGLSFWLVTAATALALAASGTPSPLYVDYQAKWGFSATTVTLIYGIYAGGVLVALLTMGGLSDRIGRRPVMIGSIGVLAASMVVFVFADNVGWLYVARAIQGVATGVFTGAAGAALSELHFRRDHRIASLVNSTATASGIAFGAVLTGMLAQWAPARLVLPYLVVAGLSVLVLIGIAIWVPETVTARQSLRSSLFRLQRLSLPAGIRREFAIGGLSVTAAWSVGGLYLALGGTLAKELLHVNNHLVAGLVILAVQGVGGLGQLMWNLSRPTASIRSSALVGSAALIVGLVLASIALATSSSAVFFIGAVATGVGFGLAFMSGTRRVTQVAPDAQRGEVLAAYFVIAYIAISVPAIIAGLVSTHLGITETFYWFAGITSVIAAIVFVAGLVEGKQSIRK